MIAGTVDTGITCMAYLEAAWNRQEVRKQIEAGARTTNGTYKVNQQTLANVWVAVPPMELQRTFAERIERVDLHLLQVLRAATYENDLFSSLQSLAFRGEL